VEPAVSCGQLTIRARGTVRAVLSSRKARLFSTLLAVPLIVSLSSLGPTFADDPPRRAPAETLLQLSADPFTDAVAQHRTEVEPDNFAFGSTVVSTFQVGRISNGGASNIGFATSTDAGVHWTNGFLPGSTKVATPPGKYDRASDASVAFDAKHNVWIISYLGLITPDPNRASTFKVDVLVSRSTDGGLTWSAAVPVDATGTKFLDKNWTACDNTPSSPFFGNCYTEYDDNSRNDLVLMSTSTDGGLNWGPGKPTSDPPNAFSRPRGTPGAHGIGGQPLVEPNGRVVVPYVNLDVELGFFAFGAGSFVSTDGGATWSRSVLISEQDFHEPNASACPQIPGCGIRAGIPLPTAEIDAAGRVYVVWSDCRFQPMCQTSDLVLSTSDDGLVWSAVQRIPISAVGSLEDHFIPGLAVDRSTSGRGARLGLTYYFYPDANCTTDTCDLNVGFISSTNGGRTWSTPEQVAGPMKLRWLPSTTQGLMVGDYISTAIPSGGARSPEGDGRDTGEAGNSVPVFAVAHAPSGGVLDEAIFTVVGENLDRGGNVPIEGVEGRGSGRDISSMGSRSDDEGEPLPLRHPATVQ
jgi:hypothetical protein